jgi:hypothetical protein
MAPEPGDTVWIPCEVRGSTFADERRVSIDSPVGRWAGIVDVRQLRDEIVDGATAIRATIVGTAHGKLAARLPGQTRHREYLTVTETLLT